MDNLSSKYNAHIIGSQGPITGEHNRIYQYFQVPQHAPLASKHIGFLPLIADKTEGFVGRQFVFDALDSFLHQKKSGYFVILGEPGIGKTALLAQLVKTRGYPHHFNVAPQNIRSPRQFLANACAQIIARYDLRHDTIPEDATGDSNFLLQCLQEAAAKPKNRPVVLVVDALDEAERLGLPARVNALYLPPTLPEGAYIVVTSRPLDDLKIQVSVQQSLFLEPDSKGNLLDIRTYIQNYLETSEKLRARLSAWNTTHASFVKGLARKSEGNFIYLRYVLPAIAEGKFMDGALDELPQGLAAYYRGHWNQMQIAEPQTFDDLYAPVVCMLAVVREPVTVAQLHRWTGKDRAHIRRAIARWREFLEEGDSIAERKYRVYHTSFQDFLGEMVDLKRFDEIIARYYLGILGME
ncbi:MAG: AAA family ATPase [Anaerolineales bacterium]